MIAATNDSQAALRKADVYSFGIILYELVGKQGPFGKRYDYSDDTVRSRSPHLSPGTDLYQMTYSMIINFLTAGLLLREYYC